MSGVKLDHCPVNVQDRTGHVNLLELDAVMRHRGRCRSIGRSRGIRRRYCSVDRSICAVRNLTYCRSVGIAIIYLTVLGDPDVLILEGKI